MAHAYDDDLQVYCHMNVGSEQIMLQRFSECADSVSRWMSSNRLSLTRRKRNWFGFTVVLGNLVLLRMTFCFLANALPQFTSAVRDLGVMLDSNMTMSQHVLRVCQNCYFQLRLIRRLGKALSVESKPLLVHALVHSRLDYCNSVLACLPWSLVQQLQSVLDSAARLIFGLKPWWNCIGFRTHSTLHTNCVWLCLLFKYLRGSAHAYLADYCMSTSLVPGRSDLRSAGHSDIVVSSHQTDWGLRSFAGAGPSSWNLLPVGLRSFSFSLETFAKHLKTYPFGLTYSLLSLYYILWSATRWQCHQTRLLLLFIIIINNELL